MPKDTGLGSSRAGLEHWQCVFIANADHPRHTLVHALENHSQGPHPIFNDLLDISAGLYCSYLKHISIHLPSPKSVLDSPFSICYLKTSLSTTSPRPLVSCLHPPLGISEGSNVRLQNLSIPQLQANATPATEHLQGSPRFPPIYSRHHS